MSGMPEWDPIDAFTTLGEYQRFLAWVDEGIREGTIVEEPVGQWYASPLFTER